MALENLNDLEAEWIVFMEDKTGKRNQWTQDQRWRADNPGEFQKLLDYRNGGARPTLVTEPGRRMVHHIDAYLKAKGEVEPPPPPPPPPNGVLRWSPPTGWNGNDSTIQSSFPTYTPINLTNGAQNLNLNDNIDYYLNLGALVFTSGENSGSGRSLGLNIFGGRNIVIVGGSILFRHLSRNDGVGILIDRGNANGKVFIEGVDIQAPNCIVMRTRREVYIQNCRLKGKGSLDSGATTDLHGDCLQYWGASYNSSEVPHKGTYLHKVSMYSDFSCITPSIEVDPNAGLGFPMTDIQHFESWDMDLHPLRADKRMPSQYMWAVSGLSASYQNNGPYLTRVGESWAEPSMHISGAYEKKIDDMVISIDLSPVYKTFPYEIKNPAGTNLYVSPAGNVGGNAPYNIAGAAGAGNYLTFDRVPTMVNHKWWIGNPPDSRGAINGQFCPDGVAGANYRPVGYA